MKRSTVSFTAMLAVYVLWAGALAALLTLSLPMTAAEAPEQPERSHVMLGKDLFHSYCSSCHGETGKGDGPIAEHLLVPPKDLTKLAGDDGRFPYEDVVQGIDGRAKVRAHGSPDMPIWGEVFQKTRTGADEADVRGKLTSLTHYLWSLQAEPIS